MLVLSAVARVGIHDELRVRQMLRENEGVDLASSKECITFSLSADRFAQPTVRTARKRVFPAIIFA
jgi:hypothetical protein